MTAVQPTVDAVVEVLPGAPIEAPVDVPPVAPCMSVLADAVVT